MINWDSAAFDRWLTTDPVNQEPLYVPDDAEALLDDPCMHAANGTVCHAGCGCPCDECWAWGQDS